MWNFRLIFSDSYLIYFLHKPHLIFFVYIHIHCFVFTLCLFTFMYSSSKRVPYFLLFNFEVTVSCNSSFLCLQFLLLLRSAVLCWAREKMWFPRWFSSQICLVLEDGWRAVTFLRETEYLARWWNMVSSGKSVVTPIEHQRGNGMGLVIKVHPVSL